jgi:hypothetical protein
MCVCVCVYSQLLFFLFLIMLDFPNVCALFSRWTASLFLNSAMRLYPTSYNGTARIIFLLIFFFFFWPLPCH